ncbi:MAG: haloacid dehalogenase type II [Dehalococcoidia bacterium]|nr:haloacid dehalogenase type II [Dehalococcoidia bacterium]
MPSLRVLFFDAYGTIFDVHSIATECDRLAPGKGAEMSQLWRTKQLEYTWLRSLMGKYEDFHSVTESALDFTAERLGVKLDAASRKRLMDAYLRLNVFPDVREALPQLSAYQLAILSNGSPNVLEPLVRNAGLGGVFKDIISVDPARVYKPSPRVYQLGCDRYGVKPEEAGFISANSWDATGAKAFGLNVFWLNRGGNVYDQLGYEPDAVITRLTELAPILKGGAGR